MRSDACQTLSTTDVSPSARVERWNDFGSETLSSISVDPSDKESFTARLSRLELGSLGFTWMSTTPAICRGHAGRVGAWAAPTKDAFLLQVQDSGACRMEQLGREAELGPGDLVLHDATRPWFSQCVEPMSVVIVKLPTERLIRKLGDPAAFSGLGLSASQGSAALASSMILSIKRTLASEAEDDWGDTLSDLVLDVLALAYGRVTPCDASRQKGLALRREAFAYVEQHLDDPQLSVTGIAEALGTNTRYVQRLFIEIGVTPRQYILDRRLDAAAEQLRRAGAAKGVSVTEVAYDAGFNDLSYFTRSFSKKFGVSPREYRKDPKRAVVKRLKVA